MALTPETIARHELNGLCVRVVAADSSDYVGIGGRVVSESKKTLSIRDGRDKQVPKSGTTFEFSLPTDEAEDPRKGIETAEKPARASEHDGDSTAYVTVEGDRLLSQPARRTETTGDSPWR